MKIDGGAIIWARQTIDSKIFYDKPDKWFKIWFYLIAKANHTGNKQFSKGSCFMKYEWIMEKTKATRSEVDHCIRWLKSATMIATQKAIRGFTVDVLKYPDFQNLQNYKSDTKSDTNGETKAKQKRNKSDTINKNYKNVKNVKNSTNTIPQIETLISQFPTDIQPLVKEYTDIARLQNKTERMSLRKEYRLTNELHLLWSLCDGDIDKTDFRQALKTTVSNEAPNINYVKKVKDGIIRKRSARMKGGIISS